jgi:hypothetical protein
MFGGSFEFNQEKCNFLKEKTNSLFYNKINLGIKLKGKENE